MPSISNGLNGSSVPVDGRTCTPATPRAAVGRDGAAVGADGATVGADGATVGADGATVGVAVATGATVGATVAEGATVNGGRVGGIGAFEAPPAHASVRNLSLISETSPFRASALP